MFRLDENVRNKFYKQYGKTEKTVQEDINLIREWIKTQKHLPEIMEDVKIRNFLQLNKFNIERTKEKIDAYYTIRSKIPEFFEKGNPSLPNIKGVFDNTYFSMHPKLLDETHRIIFIKQKKFNVFSPTDIAKLALCTFEIRLYEDCMINDIIIFDLSNLTLRDAGRVSPKFVIKAFSIYKNVFSLRLKTLHFLNSPFYVSIWVAIMKFVLKPKLLDRIQIHRDTEVLKEIFSNEDLPKDYGGNGPTLEELNVMMHRKVDSYQDRFDIMDTLQVNEALRPKKLHKS